MNFSQIFLCFLSFIIRTCLYFWIDTEAIRKIPFFYSKFSSYENLEDAFFLIEKGVNPYEVDLIFHVNQI